MDPPVHLAYKRMKKLLQVNPVLRANTSTGRIMQEIGNLAIAHGWESYLAYSGGRDGRQACSSHLVPVGNKASVLWHGLMTRLFDRHGLASVSATRRFIRQIGAIAPDVIHIHNLHGYFLNYPLFFDYLANRSRARVIWTVHDCWLYTGHCYHYTYAGCYKWQHGCSHCPQKHKFPASYGIDRSARNYLDKQRSFTSLPPERLTIVPVSEWLRGELEHSFFRGYDFRVIHNGIDTDVFDICDDTDVRRRYGLQGKHILLGVASIWSEEKGLTDFIRLAERLAPDEHIVLVGVTPKQQASLPTNITGIARTADIRQLAELYAAADAFVNPTRQDNYPTVNLEAIACGTPVVTYRTGGSVEAVTEHTGLITEPGDIDALLEAVREIERRGADYYRPICRAYALAHFRKEDRYADYLTLYDELLNTITESN